MVATAHKDLSTEVKELRGALKKNEETLTTLQKGLGDLVNVMKRTPAGVDPRALGFGPGAPRVRTGENPLTSRGWSLQKMLGVLTGAIEPQHAKVELGLHEKMHQAFVTNLGKNGGEPFEYGGRHRPGEKAFLAPIATSYFPADCVNQEFRTEMKQLIIAGADGADPDEMKWVRMQQLKSLGYDQKTLSWLNEFLGGSLVAPPEMGELIELLRNKEALVNAGARTVPLPPQGRMKYPKQTLASLTYWVGENAPITPSDIGTGEIILQAKKLAVLIKSPNELIRFASPATEALLRDDMTKSLALALDLAGLEGTGKDTQPKGVINYQNINRITSSVKSPTGGGDGVAPQDIYRMIALVEENNAEFEGFIMRPKTLYKYYQIRADAVGTGDNRGPFVFNLIREAGDGYSKATLGGYPVTKSTQVSQVRSQGNSGNTLTYILGGMFSDILIGMFGAIEFAATTMGDTPFINDQTWVRGIVSADVQIRHEAAIVLMDNLDTTI